MKKSIWAAGICLAAALCLGCASADSWKGSVVPLETVQVTAPAQGVMETLTLETGARAEAGEQAGSIRPEKIYAAFDGTVTAVSGAEGEPVSGTVLEISPISLYTVSCTVTRTAQTPENALVRPGQTVYIRCRTDRTHRAEAMIISVTGSEFTAETVAGELYIGESVFLYGDPSCLAGSRVGVGTVTAHDPLTVNGEGVIRKLRVQAGDRVERGQWLFSLSSSAENEITIPASGIVTKVNAAAGEQVREGQELAEITVSCAIRIAVPADDAGIFAPGQEWAYIRGDDPHEEMHPCRVSRVLAHAEDASADVELIPGDETLLPVGMSIVITESIGGEASY